MREEVLEQLERNCPCTKDLPRHTFAHVVETTINLISAVTGWTNELCETFLKGYRRETFVIDNPVWCSCCENDYIFTTPLYYEQIDTSAIKVYVYHQQGVQDIAVRVSDEDIFYSDLDGVLRINTRPYINERRCHCKVDYKIVVEYLAGYDCIPTCLLDDLCMLLNIVADTINNCGDCDDCDDDERLTPNSVLASKSVGEITYTWDNDKALTLDGKLSELVTAGFFKQLSLLSLNKPSSNHNESWFAIAKGKGTCHGY